MPIDYRHYPPNWKAEIRPRIMARAANRCECLGECGLHRHWRCQEFDGRKARFARGKIVLTVAHRDHDPMNCDPENLRAYCQRCHLRYDQVHHMRKRRPPQPELALEDRYV